MTPQCEILGDLIAILSGGESSQVKCGASIKHVNPTSLPMQARVPQGNFYV